MSFGTRIAVNSDHSTLLVRNLPSDAEEIERLRRYLVIMIEGLDASLHALQAQMLLDSRRELLAQALQAARDNLLKINEISRRQTRVASEVVAAMADELETALLRLDLSRQQLKPLLDIIESSTARMKSPQDEQQNPGDQFEAMIDELSAALDE